MTSKRDRDNSFQMGESIEPIKSCNETLGSTKWIKMDQTGYCYSFHVRNAL